jgi:tRNA G18 (ribose-2'-O)-methylase SpoU
MTRAIDSLNASVACALALYEVGRQRRAFNEIP